MLMTWLLKFLGIIPTGRRSRYVRTSSTRTVTEAGHSVEEGEIPLDQLPPELRDALRAQVGSQTGEKEFVFHRTTEIDPKTGRQTVTHETGESIPAEIAELMRRAQESGDVEQHFTYVDPNGKKLVYRSLEEMPPHVRKIFEKQ